jgi:ABC-type dipeptide/oligopeptide/nickel transport system permease component
LVGFLIRRLAITVVVVWGVVSLLFVLVRLLPGDPATLMLGPTATPDQITTLRHQLGTDKSIALQYGSYIRDVAHSDFGTSIVSGQPAMSDVLDRLPASITLALVAMAFSQVLGLLLGAIGALSRGSLIDRLILRLCALGQAIPNFWLGIMLILLLSSTIKLFPSSGIGGVPHIVLPAITLGLPILSVVTRLFRRNLVSAVHQPFMLAAEAKGLPARVRYVKHAGRNAIMPVITLSGLQLGYMFGSAVIVETVFAWPGIGRLVTDAIAARDYPVVTAAVFVISALSVIANLLVDIGLAYTDPRIRVGSLAS